MDGRAADAALPAGLAGSQRLARPSSVARVHMVLEPRHPILRSRTALSQPCGTVLEQTEANSAWREQVEICAIIPDETRYVASLLVVLESRSLRLCSGLLQSLLFRIGVPDTELVQAETLAKAGEGTCAMVPDYMGRIVCDVQDEMRAGCGVAWSQHVGAGPSYGPRHT